MIRVICVAGDSHAWGQGAADEVFQNFEIPVCEGEKRLLPFSVPSFPSLLRNYINKNSGSEAIELSGTEISKQYGLDQKSECACVCGELCINEPFDFARIELKKGSQDAEILCDAEVIQTFRADCCDDYEVINVMPKHSGNRLVIRSSNALLYRVELYRGQYAVVNCGIGSCPSLRYTTDYLDKYVLQANPYMVITEIFTVNDWITCKSARECEQNLLKFGKRIIEHGAKLAFTSVVPILGKQENTFGADYSEYIQAGSRAAKLLNVPYADTYHAFSKEYADNPQTSHYGDAWHPGPRGHEIYFKEIKKLDMINELFKASSCQ